MDTSIFTDKTSTPTDNDLKEAIGNTYNTWHELITYVLQKYPKGISEWNYPGAKYGWSFRIKDKKRAIIYLLPRDKFFLVAFVYGQNAAEQALSSNISKEIKSVIELAPVYAEGRGFRVPLYEDIHIDDIKKLIDIKLAN